MATHCSSAGTRGLRGVALLEDTSQLDRAIDYLQTNTGAATERIREVLIAEIARLGDTAIVTRYIGVLAISNVRAQLRNRAHVAADAQAASPAA